MDSELAAFPYVNGGLFAEEHIEIPQLDEQVKKLLLAKASDDFDWSEISPTIFGAVFESTLNPETRRSGGMHYTSIENIHKVIDPLFLDDLKAEFAEICELKIAGTRKKRLEAFQEKLAALTFLDPACGSGNFLTETYLSLRRLENEILSLLNLSKHVDFIYNPIKVSIGQFYGIEINDFAVTVAKTALWIAESQMMKATEDIVHMDLDFLPLKSYANIVEGNALRLDWNDVIPKENLNYIMGNPPFVGASMMTTEQKKEATAIFGKIKLSNSIDYVGAWYHKAAQLMQHTQIKAALVSTNSITQGEQVAPLWKTLFVKYGIHIDFAYRTFRWDSEANIKAHVHCVIIGFSIDNISNKRFIYDADNKYSVSNINPYLIDAPNVMIASRSKPICNVPSMLLGNKPTDDGNFILSVDEKMDLLKKEPDLECFIHRYIGAVEFIQNKIRYCLWLKGASPYEISKSHELTKRIENVRRFRLESTSSSTREKANTPHLFFFVSQPENEYILIPSTSSEKRPYIPIGFLDKSIIASNAATIIPNATLYHFGILTSSVHMAWVRIVCGRLEMRYRYSNSVVYNNFPWCESNDKQIEEIEKTAQAILDARALYSDCSLAILYNDVTMPIELRRAHQANDRAVMKAYGFAPSMTEPEIVAELMKRYQGLTAGGE